MARIVFSGYMFRYPMGGMLSNTLHYLNGLIKLGYDVYFIEKSGWENYCFDPVNKQTSNDCSYGFEKNKLLELLKTADLYIDYGSHGTWYDETVKMPLKVLIDGEPGTTQFKMQMNIEAGQEIPIYDYYYTVGQNIGLKIWMKLCGLLKKLMGIIKNTATWQKRLHSITWKLKK